MSRTKIVLYSIASVVALILFISGLMSLAAAQDEDNRQHRERMDKQYAMCLEAGGSYSTSPWDGDTICQMPGTGEDVNVEVEVSK